MSSHWMQEMSSPEIAEKLKQTDTVLIPMGATEQHGPHLPLGVDTFIPMCAAERIAEITGVPIVPPVWFAPCNHHMGFPGTISIRPTTVIALLTDICRSLRQHGFKNIILLNGHTGGYNPALLSAADEVQELLPDTRVWVADVAMMSKEAMFRVCTSEALYHADEVEASLMLVARGDLVHLEKASKILPVTRSKFLPADYRAEGDQIYFRMTGEDWRNLTAEGHIGDPTVSTVEKGEAMMSALVDNVVQFIQDLAANPLNKGGSRA